MAWCACTPERCRLSASGIIVMVKGYFSVCLQWNGEDTIVIYSEHKLNERCSLSLQINTFDNFFTILLGPTPLLTAQCYLDGRGGSCSISSGNPLRVLRTRSVCVVLGHTRHAQAQERQRHMNFCQHFITPSHKYNRLLPHNRDRHTYTGTAGRVALTRPCSPAQATGLGPSRQPTTLSMVLCRHETRHRFPAPRPSLSCSVG